MIKFFKSQDIIITPFTIAKSQTLNSISSDLILGTDGDDTFPIIGVSLNCDDNKSGSCSPIESQNYLAISQFDDSILFRLGKFVFSSSIFYPSGSTFFNLKTNPLNLDGTYQRQVYNTVKKMYYNDYNNAYNIFGFDGFDTSKANLQLPNDFSEISLKSYQAGDKIRPKSILFNNQSGDIIADVKDDGNHNLILSGTFFVNKQKLTSDSYDLTVPLDICGLGAYLSQTSSYDDSNCCEVGDQIGNNPVTPTPTPTVTFTVTPTISVTQTITPTISVTQTVTPTPTISPSYSLTPSPSFTVTPSVSTSDPNTTPTVTPSITESPTITPSISNTSTATPSLSVTPTVTFTPSSTITPSLTPTPTCDTMLNALVKKTLSTGGEQLTITVNTGDPLDCAGCPCPGGWYIFTHRWQTAGGVPINPTVYDGPYYVACGTIVSSINPYVNVPANNWVLISEFFKLPDEPQCVPVVTLSQTPTVTVSPSVTITQTPTPSISFTPTITPSLSLTPTVTPSISISLTPSVTPSATQCVCDFNNPTTIYLDASSYNNCKNTSYFNEPSDCGCGGLVPNCSCDEWCEGEFTKLPSGVASCRWNLSINGAFYLGSNGGSPVGPGARWPGTPSTSYSCVEAYVELQGIINGYCQWEFGILVNNNPVTLEVGCEQISRTFLKYVKTGYTPLGEYTPSFDTELWPLAPSTITITSSGWGSAC